MAGPVTIGVFLIHRDHVGSINFADDSKKLSEKKREEMFKELNLLKKQGICNFVTVSKNALQINKKGISFCIKDSIRIGLSKIVEDPTHVHVKLDGLLSAPEEYIFQETITKGDSKEKVIGAASIVAKVTRDRYMNREAKKYPEYGFENHKGYGTRVHVEAIKKHGIINHHRNLWVRNIT